MNTKSIIAIAVLGMSVSTVFSQKNLYISRAQMILLEKNLEETSGLCMTSEGLWSINDSHNPNEVHLLPKDSVDSQIESNQCYFWGGQPAIKNVRFPIPVQNNDWEAIETDGKHLFIGDFGNNAGARRDLRIIELKRVDTGLQVVKIYNFKYENQTNFERRKLHNFDCEAFKITDSSFQLFTKNWKNLRCNIYEFKIPSDNDSSVQVARKIASFNPKFLVTDVSYLNDGLFFCGYSPSGNQYIGYLRDKTFNHFWRVKLPYKPAQFEAIQATEKGLFLSTESRKTMPATLFYMPFIFVF